MKAQPQYLKLTQDIVFKTFFSRNKQVLISLLKAFLPISDEVADVVILNPEKRERSLKLKNPSLLPDTPERKRVVLDLNIKLASGENINIEMQAVQQPHFLNRMLFYWAKLYSQDLEKGEAYHKIHPAYSLIFTTFSVFGNRVEDCINSFSIRSDKYHDLVFSEDLRIIVAELNKLPDDCRSLLDKREQWCYILKHSSELTAGEYNYLSQEEELKMALEHLDELSREERLFWEAWDREKAERDWISSIEGSREEGIEEGIEKGRAEERHQVALNMLHKGFELSVISEATGLSEAEIKQIKSAD